MNLIKPDYPIYIIKSPWALKQIQEFIEIQFGAEPNDIGYMKILTRKRNQILVETNMTLILMKSDIYEEILKQNYMSDPMFTISPYTIKSNLYPKPEYSKNIFIPFGINENADDVIYPINDILVKCARFNLIKADDYKIVVPLQSRQTGQHKGKLFVNFPLHVNIEVIILIKLLLTNLPINQEHVTCLWSKEYKKKN